jgi:8-oxo-dGTP pyrophosphatase MutT (NUDIX family)
MAIQKDQAMADCSLFILWLPEMHRALMENRPEYVENSGDYWVYPGGKLEPDETREQGMIREMQEEIDCTPIAYHYIGSGVGANGWKTHGFLVTAWEGIVPDETNGKQRSKLAWIDPWHIVDLPPGPTARVEIARHVVRTVYP